MRYASLYVLVLAGAAMADSTQGIAVYGHRGARALRPENTLPAFEYAISAGVDALELDLAVTRDDVLVVSHDPVLNPAICRAPASPPRIIRELTLRELKLWDCGSLKNPAFPKQQPVPGTDVPTLDEVLDLAGRGSFDFNIETKIFEDHPEYTPSPERFVELLLDSVRRHKLESRVIVQSFDMRTLRAMRKLAPHIRISVLFENDPEKYIAEAQAMHAEILSPEKRLASKIAGRGSFQIVPWTANTPADWDKLIALKVSGIITDDPAALIAYLAHRGLRPQAGRPAP
jgi:glycerophosphoryl diester phosphodiesterase